MKTASQLRIIALAVILILMSPFLYAAEYYVVIGAFAQESNAKRFTTTVRSFLQNVSYTYNENSKLYYVTAMKTARKDDARNLASYLKNEKGFTDAWVLTQGHENPDGPRLSRASDAPASTSTVAFYSSEAPSFKNDSESLETSASASEDLSAAWTFTNGLGYIPGIDNAESFDKLTSDPSAKLFTFVVQDELGNPFPSEVMLVDFAAIRKIVGFQPGETVAIKSTKREQVVTFVCDRLGYRQETRMFNMDHLSRSKDIHRNSNGVWEVLIKLSRMQVSDFSFMNKTLFYKDAAVLEPSSKAELDELVAIMKSNPGYRIVLHSHCNAGEKREIKVPAVNGSYFDLERTTEKNGSDKALTKKRAEVVRNYLLDNGIDKNRLQIVAWGSMEPIVSPSCEDAHINDRIEIELVN